MNPPLSRLRPLARLNAHIAQIVARQAELREQIDAIVADLERDDS